MTSFTTNAEFIGLSPAIYKNVILHSELKILAKIQLSVVCAHMVDYHRSSHMLYKVKKLF